MVHTWTGDCGREPFRLWTDDGAAATAHHSVTVTVR